MKFGPYLWSFAILLVVVGLYANWSFNKLISQRNRLREAWSGMDVQLKRRHALVPPLIACVMGYRDHEQSLLENLARMRSGAQTAQGIGGTGIAENGLSRELHSLLAVAEAWPDLKADGTFRQLSATLVQIEDQIQYARRYYNGTVRDFNNLVQTFPGLIAARLFGFLPADYFEIQTATERQPPEVKL